MKVITIGRSANNDVVIRDPNVSRNHLQIIEDDRGNFKIFDFGSANGTFVNGKKISGEISLNNNDIIRIGNTTLPWMSYFLERNGSHNYNENINNINIGVPPYSPSPSTRSHSTYSGGGQPIETTSGFGWWTKCFKKYADFNGRARRKEYWVFTLVQIFIFILLYLAIVLGLIAQINQGGDLFDSPILLIGLVLISLYALASFLPTLAVCIRRLHDTGKSGAYYLMILIPIIGSIIIFVFMCIDSQRGENKYGPNPKNIN